MQQLGGLGNFDTRFRVVQQAVDQLPFEKFGIVSNAVTRCDALVGSRATASVR